jgi:thioredoxin-like negative regulator of GroEL
MTENYTQKYLKYKEKYLALQKEYTQLIKMKNMKGGNASTSIMLFKADWCKHCTNFKPVWAKTSELYNTKYKFIEYDVDNNKKEFEEYKVNGMPTVLVKNGSNVYPYNGERTFDGFNNFLNELN